MWAAAKNPNPQVLEALFKYGANPFETMADGKTLLIAAASSNDNPAVAGFLLEQGIDPKQADKYNATAADYARNNPALFNTDVYWRLLG